MPRLPFRAARRGECRAPGLQCGIEQPGARYVGSRVVNLVEVVGHLGHCLDDDVEGRRLDVVGDQVPC
jgi:hypothetical protein